MNSIILKWRSNVANFQIKVSHVKIGKLHGVLVPEQLGTLLEIRIFRDKPIDISLLTTQVDAKMRQLQQQGLLVGKWGFLNGSAKFAVPATILSYLFSVFELVAVCSHTESIYSVVSHDREYPVGTTIEVRDIIRVD